MSNKSEKFNLGVGQAHELEMAINRNGGWDAAMLKVLCTGNNLGLIREYFLGEAVICYPVTRQASPWKPKGWRVLENKGINETFVERRGDSLFVDHEKIEFFQCQDQLDRASVPGKIVLDCVESEPRMSALNANYLHFFLSHKHMIPDSWKRGEDGRSRTIFFPYTVYKDPQGGRCVMGLHWNGTDWTWVGRLLSGHWDISDCVAVTVR